MKKSENQVNIYIGNVDVPIIQEGGERYYPISYMGSKVLLKDLSPSQLRKNGYSEYIKIFNIDYGENTGGIQETHCISEEGLKKILGNSKIGRLNVNQKKAMNEMLEYLGMKLICEDERFRYDVDLSIVSEYSEYLQDCINDVLSDNPNIVWQKCSKCNKYYPYHLNFYKENKHCGKDYELYTICRSCSGCSENRSKDYIRLFDSNMTFVHRKYGDIVYNYYKKHDTISIYKHWISLNKTMMPTIINNDEDKLIIIKYLYNNGYFEKYDDLTSNVIHKVCKFRVDGKNLIKRIHNQLFGVYLRNGVEYINDINNAKIIFFNYLKDNNISIDELNIYDLDYEYIFKECKLRGFLKRYGNNILTLIMDLFDNIYPAYKFTTRGLKYWDVFENRYRALKYLIEKDMKIPIEKIPLYLTLENLRKKSGTMRNLLRKYYNNNIYLWVNEIYPDRFDEEDFNITVIRNVFDSAEESLIHDVLVSRFKNVLYNQRGTKNTINLKGMQPDWFIFTDKGVWVIEYFGISVDIKAYNQRTYNYQNKTLSKIERYKELDWLRTIYVYPEDLKDNFKGLEKKIKDIV